MWCQKIVSAITIIRYKSVRYIGVFLWELDRDLAGSTKKCPLQQGVSYNNMSAIDRLTLYIRIIRVQAWS